MAMRVQGADRQVVVQPSRPVAVTPVQSVIGALAKGISDVGDAAFAWQDEIDTADAKRADAAFSDKVRGILYDDQTGFLNARGGDAVGRHASVNETLQQAYDEVLGGVSGRVRGKVEASLQARVGQARQSVDVHTAGERRTYLDAAAEARTLTAINDAIADPGKVAQSLGIARQEIADLAARNGWDASVTAQKTAEATSKVHTGIVSRLAAADPMTALEYLRQNRDSIEGGEMAALERQLVPMAKEYQGRALGAAAMGGGTVSDSYYASIRAAESGGNDRSKNPSSSAAGRYQFIDSTWRGLMKSHPELGLTADGRFDPEQQERAIRAFTEDNARQLVRAGVAVTNGTLYAAHFLGVGAAAKVLRAGPAVAIADLVGDGVMRANRFLSGMNVGDFVRWADRKAGGGGTVSASGSAPAQAPEPRGIGALLDIEDPVVRDAALQEYNLRAGVAAKQAEAMRDAAQNEAFAMIEGGGRVDDLSIDTRRALGQQAMTSLRSYQSTIASGQKVETDFAVYADLREKAAADPAAFLTEDPVTWRPLLADAEFKELVGIRSSIINGQRDPDPAKSLTVSNIRTAASTALDAAGVGNKKPRDLKTAAQFETAAIRWADGFVQREGRQPTPVELDAQINAMLVPYVIDPPGLGNQRSGRTFEFDPLGDPMDAGDDIDAVAFDQATLKVNDKAVPLAHRRAFSDEFEAVYGRKPSMQEMIEGLAASGVY